MKWFSLFIVSFFLSNSYGQFNYLNGPDVTMEITQSYQSEAVKCFPSVPMDATFNWSLISIDPSIPAEWDLVICDNHLCYPGEPTSGTPISFTEQEFIDSAYYFLKLGVSTYQVAGSGTVTFYIEDEQALVGDTVSFTINQADVTGISNHSELPFSYSCSGQQINIKFNDNQNHEVQLFNTSCQRIFTSEAVHSEIISGLKSSQLYIIIIDGIYSEYIFLN